ncbi:GAF domain-containing protein [Streptomyces hoynatensis]|uniref:protein-serine/threonine phosphatase n=1 Tax=Streptomyces hoynatensis TaxID=1141874 RepID=A0A3A9Z480_9ACTN|nr:GAF domain-containing protein [Streptomyces hoynatensis]
MLESGLEWVVRESGASVGGVALLDPEERVLRMAALAGLPPDMAAPWLRIGLDEDVPLAQVVRSGRPSWVPVGDLPRRYPQLSLLLPYPFALADVPISAGGTCWGALSLFFPSNHPRELSRRQWAVLEAGCRRIGTMLCRAAEQGRPVRAGDNPHLCRPRGYVHSPEAAQAAAELLDLLPEGHCRLDLEGRVTYGDAAAAELLGTDLRALLGRPPWQALPWLTDPVYEDRYRSALFSRRATSFTALRPPDRALRFQLYPGAFGFSMRISPAPQAPAERRPPAESRAPVGANAPGEGRAEGGAPGEGAPGEGGAQAAGGVTAAPGGGVAPVEGVEPTRAGVLYQMMRLVSTLTETFGVKDVVSVATDQIMPVLDAQALVLFVVDSGRLRIVGQRGYEPSVLDRFDAAPLRPPDTPSARAAEEGRALFYGSPGELERDYPDVVLVAGKGAWVFLPLIVSGRPVGACAVAYDRPRSFTPNERTLMPSIAAQLAQALDRALLYDATQQFARRLQTGLLPRTLPQVPGLEVAARYLPATRGMEIGGDFYDVIRLSGNEAGAAIGDVQGHNIKAAALMGQVRTAVHAGAGTAPGAVLARTNRLLIDLDPGLFTSCVYAHIDLGNRCATLASAGHPPPLLRHPDGRVTVLRIPPGPLLGVVPEAGYPEIDVQLAPGTVLLMYTDGLIERPGGDLDEAAGEVAAYLTRETDSGGPLEDLADALIRRYTGAEEVRRDDVALLLLGVRQ